MDYRDLLMRYICHVGECEGISFIFDSERTPWFSDEQWEELKRLDVESKAIPPVRRESSR